MPLDPSGLESDLLLLFASPPATAALCATDWASAADAYAAGIIPPSASVSAAASALDTALAAAFVGPPPVGAVVDVAFQVFAAAVGVGMAPAFTATPPAAPPGFVAGLLPPFPATHAAAAAKWRAVIDVWMKTGSAVPSGGGPAVGWT